MATDADFDSGKAFAFKADTTEQGHEEAEASLLEKLLGGHAVILLISFLAGVEIHHSCQKRHHGSPVCQGEPPAAVVKESYVFPDIVCF